MTDVDWNSNLIASSSSTNKISRRCNLILSSSSFVWFVAMRLVRGMWVTDLWAYVQCAGVRVPFGFGGVQLESSWNSWITGRWRPHPCKRAVAAMKMNLASKPAIFCRPRCALLTWWVIRPHIQMAETLFQCTPWGLNCWHN
jgi:hypothetical protein